MSPIQTDTRSMLLVVCLVAGVYALAQLLHLLHGMFFSKLERSDASDRVDPKDFDHYVKASPKGAGTKLSYLLFSKGRFCRASLLARMTLMTTMTTDIVDALWDICRSRFPDIRRRVVSPNSPVKSSFLIAFERPGLEIRVRRAMKDVASLADDPLGAEDPRNYWVECGFKGKDAEALLEEFTGRMKKRRIRCYRS